MPNPHDALFHCAFADPVVAGALLRQALPAEIHAAIDWTTCEGLPEGSVDGTLARQERDLVFSVRARSSRVAFRFLIEHKSRAEPRAILQVLRYVASDLDRAAAEGAGGLPLIVPVLIHHGPSPWTVERSLGELVDTGGFRAVRLLHPELARVLLAHGVSLTPRLLDLAALDEAALLAWPLPSFAGLALLALQFLRGASPDAAARAIERWAGRWRDLLREPGGASGLQALSSYILEVTDLRSSRLADLLHRLAGETARDHVMSTAEKLRAEGRIEGLEKGRQEGRQEGRNEGKLALLERQLQRRFGVLPASATARLRAATGPELDAIGDRLLSAPSLDAVLDG